MNAFPIRALAAMAALTVLGGAAAKGPSSEPERGRVLYVSIGCFQCHGYVGQGSSFSGPALAPAPLGPASFRDLVRHPRGQMPSYSEVVLPDDQLSAIYAYLKSIPPGRSPDDIPLLAARAAGPKPADRGDAAHGATLFAANCAGCHGPKREGAVAASLLAEPSKRSAEGTRQLIVNPPRGMPKLYPSPLSDADVADVAAYVRQGR